MKSSRKDFTPALPDNRKRLSNKGAVRVNKQGSRVKATVKGKVKEKLDFQKRFNGGDGGLMDRE